MSTSALPRVRFQVRVVPNNTTAMPPPVDVVSRMSNLGPWFARVPGLIREGPGSVGEQIDLRTHFALDGSRRAWREPWYAVGRPQPEPVKAGEQIMWNAVRGRGPGAVTKTGANFAGIAVDDNQVRQLAAALGNQIVSPAPYFEFVTGNWSNRSEPARAVPVKPVNRANPARRGGPRPKVQVKNYDEEKAQFAMFWFLLYAYGVELTVEEVRAGISTPPKNLGWNPVLLDRLRVDLGRYVVGASYSDRGDFFDPKKGGGGRRPIPAEFRRRPGAGAGRRR